MELWSVGVMSFYSQLVVIQLSFVVESWNDGGWSGIYLDRY